jgi:hypothetical protein
MISELQQSLHDIYQVSPGYDVRDFLVTDRTFARILGQQAMLTNTDETLLVSQDEDGLALSLFLDRDMLERLDAANPLLELRAEQLDDLWKVLEGISHFTCIAWRAAQNREVSLLELELQGEVDKYVGSMLLALGQGNADLTARLHGWLFDDVSFDDELDEAALERYRTANAIASRYCRDLHERMLANGGQVLAELRKFYRLPLSDKITHTRSRMFGR